MFHDRETWQHLKKSRASRMPERHAKEGRRPVFLFLYWAALQSRQPPPLFCRNHVREGGAIVKKRNHVFVLPPFPHPKKKTRRQSTYKTEGPCQDWMCHHLVNTHTRDPRPSLFISTPPLFRDGRWWLGPEDQPKGLGIFFLYFMAERIIQSNIQQLDVSVSRRME